MAKTKRKQTVLEAPTRLSESIVWEMQRRYYDQQSLKAWSGGDVPFWITSNPFIARAYAQIIVGFVRDWIAAGRKIDPREPVHIVELGSGTGQLGWHLAREVNALKESLGMTDVSFQVVLTDFTVKNLKEWEGKPHWKTLLKNGLVDFALFDADHPNDPQLRTSKKVLNKKSVRNPMVLIANYLFDTIRQDVFRVKDGKLFETKVALTYKEEGEPKPDDPKLFNKMKFTTSRELIGSDYYEDTHWNTVLENYRQSLKEADMLFPVGALKCIRHFLEMSQYRLLQICGDKTYRNEHEVSEGVGAHLTPHGSFSTMVNGDAIGKYFEQLGGTAIHCEHGENTFTNSIFVVGDRKKTGRPESLKLSETRTAYRACIDGFSPSDYVKVFEGLNKRLKKTSLEQAVALLRFSNWDTEMFCDFEDVIEANLPEASEDQKRDLRYALDKLWEHYFPLDAEQDDIAFRIGRFIFGLGEYARALELFKYSHRHTGPHHATWFNIGLCHEKLGRVNPAKNAFGQSLALDPTYAPAKKELKKLKTNTGKRKAKR